MSANDPTSAAQIQQDQLDKIRIEDEYYMRAHSGQSEVIQEFAYAVLKRKADHVRSFGTDFFSK
jgi:hypothetical protein